MKNVKFDVRIANGVSEQCCRAAYKLVESYFENPENQKAFEQWQAQRQAQAVNKRMC